MTAEWLDGFIWGVGVSYLLWIAFVWHVWKWKAPREDTR